MRGGGLVDRRQTQCVSLRDLLPTPVIARAIPDHGQQPSRQAEGVDSILVTAELEKGLGGEVLRHRPVAHAAQGKPVDGRQVRAVELVESVHVASFPNRTIELTQGVRGVLAVPAAAVNAGVVSRWILPFHGVVRIPSGPGQHLCPGPEES